MDRVIAYWKRRKEARKKRREAIIREQRKAERERHESQEHADNEQIIRALERISDQANTYTHQERTQNDRSEGWERRKFWLEIAAVIAAFIGAYILLFTLEEAKRSTAAAQQSANAATAQLEATDRPWIKATPKAWSAVKFTPEGNMSFSVTFDLTNVGHSVATHVTIRPGGFIPAKDMYFTEPIERQKTLCNKSEADGLSLTLFPNDTKQLNVGINISREEMEKNVVAPPPGAQNPPVPSGKRINPVLFGCVDYRFASLPKHHQTGFIYTIARTEPSSPNIPFLIIIGQDLPSDRVRLEDWMFGGDEAN